MSENNKKYWTKRQEQKYLAGEKKINDYYAGLKKSFEQAKKEIEKVIYDFVMRYGVENESPSYAVALRKLNKTEIGDLQAFIDKANENMGKYNLELNNMSIKARITRYQALVKQIDAQLQQLYAIEYQHSSEKLLKEVYSDSYYQTWFNIDQYHGFHQEFAQISAKTVNELITYPFNGADFSTRLWKQKDYMLQSLNESITTMLIQGRNPQTLTKEFAKKFGTKEYEAYRLLHTEGSFIIEQGTQAAYKEDGVEKYQWLATLDSKTCDDCQPKDNKVYLVSEGVVGISLPPKHAFCRCTTVPYYDDQDLSGNTRVARNPLTSKNQSVPADMNYEQWHKKYIKGNQEAELAEKKLKNIYADKQQYENYREVLGAEYIPKSFDKFQKIKYGNSMEYGILNAQIRGMTYYNKAVTNEPEISKAIKDVADKADVDILGFEYRIKEKESYLRKIRTNYNPDGNEYEVNDIIRYTYGASAEKLADKTLNCIDIFSGIDYNTIKVKNSWLDDTNPYKGINTTVQAPNGQKFEMQYHTRESFDLKNGELHELYEKQRLIEDEESAEYISLRNQMFKLSDKLTRPSNMERVK